MSLSKNNSIKKLAVKTLAKYGISSVDEVSIKCMIAGEGYTVIRFSSLGTNDETERLLKALYLDERIAYEDSFTYNDRERRIVFIRKDVSDEEFLYLLALELGRILTFKTECDGVIGVSALEDRNAQEFAYHMCDFARHGIVYNFFKSNPFQSIISAASVVICLSLVICFFIVKGCVGTTVVYKEAPAQTPALSAPEEKQSTAVSVTQSVTPEASTTYFATKSGSKYHTDGCGYIAGRDVKAVTSEDIQSGRYSPCSRCVS